MTHSAQSTTDDEAPDNAFRFTWLERNWVMHRPADLESLWEALSDDALDEDERLPYWVEIWPASLALAEWLSEQGDGLKGQVCLDLGCGLGFTALAGALRGARVIGMDYEAAALAHAAKNARVNGIPSPLWLVMDWRFPALAPRSCARIWAADVLYEKRFSTPVLNFLDYALAPSGRVWLADPGRNTFEDFRMLALGRGWSIAKARGKKIRPLYESRTPVAVDIWEIYRNGDLQA